MSDSWPNPETWLHWHGRVPPGSLIRHLDKWLKPRLWSACGFTDPWLWGLVRTRGSLTYRVVLHRIARTSQCTCSSRQQPCVHAAALLHGWQQKLWEVTHEAPLPGWIPEQIPPKQNPTEASPLRPTGTWVTPARIMEMEKGYQLLGQWLREHSRIGWKHLLAGGTQPVDDVAARLVDLRLPGPARMLRQLMDATEGGGHTATLRQILSRLILAQRAFGQRDRLPEDQWHALLLFTGVTLRKDTLKKQPVVDDRWLALAIVEDEPEADLRSRRIWCLGAKTGRFALILDFAWKRAPFPPGLSIGDTWEGAFHFYPGSGQVRAVPGEGKAGSMPIDQVRGLIDWEEAHRILVGQMTLDPLRLDVPILIEGVNPALVGGQPVLVDRQHSHFPIVLSDQAFQQLLAGQGEEGLRLFGRLMEGAFHPLTLVDRHRLVPLSDG